MTGLEITEERERDALQQRCCNERQAAASAAADEALKACEREREEKQDLVEAAWVADTQLQLSQLSTQDADEDQHYKSSSLSDSSESASDNEDVAGPSCQLGNQAQPYEISLSNESSDHNSDKPRRSGQVKRSTRTIESQNWQVEHGLIPAPGAKARDRALNAKKKENTKTSQLDPEFEFVE
jgi:hypothetical protein